MRERLIELIADAVGGCSTYWAGLIADHLLANGVIVPPCKVGDVVYFITSTEEGLEVEEAQIEEINYDGDLLSYLASSKYCSFDISLKEIFLTKEEAEQALRKEDEKNG